MNEKFYPMVGDIVKVVQNEKENKHRFRHYNDLALENKNYDFNISQQGPLTAIDIVSPEALTEFEKLIPERIDRHPNGDGIPFANIAPEWEGLLECTKDNMERRKELMKTMGVNKISQYIPLMIETADKWAKTVKINQNTDLTFELSKLNFTVMAKILFGTDVDDMPPVEYISYQTGERKDLPISEFYIKEM